MRLERRPVLLDALKHDRGNRKDHGRRGKLALGKDMVDEAAVQAAVAILQGVDIHETERRGGGLQDGVKPGLAHPIVGFKQTLHKFGKVRRPRADEFRQGIAMMIALAKKHAVRTKACLHEPCVFDQDAVKAYDFIEGQPGPASLHDGFAPTLQPGARRPFTFDLKACPAVGQEQKTRGAGDELPGSAANSLTGFFSKRQIDKTGERRRPANEGTEAPRAKQIVPDAVAPGQARLGRKVGFRVEGIDRCDVMRIGQIKRPAGQPFIEEPGTAGGYAGRRRGGQL